MPLLTNWDPFSELTRFQDEFNRRFAGDGRQLAFRPAVDIFEDEESINLTAELPGLKPEEVDVNVEDNLLTIKGERRLENEERREGYHRIERSYGSFTRSFSLPENVETEHVDAQLRDGVLKVRLPKKAAPQPKRIEVK